MQNAKCRSARKRNGEETEETDYSNGGRTMG
jgi:hypothetical protein